MKLTALNVYDATVALANIIDTPRVIPQTAKYRISRMYADLLPSFNLLSAERTKFIHELGVPTYAEGQEGGTPTGWSVPDGDAREQYTVKWNALLATEVEVNVTPITLMSLGDDPRGVEAKEFAMLGVLVTA